MIVLELTEDKFGKVMKAVSKISEHAECLNEMFEDLAEESLYSDRKKYQDDSNDFYGSRYGMRRGGRRM